MADVADTAIAQVAGEIGERPTPKQMGQVMKAATAIAAGKADGLAAAVKAGGSCFAPYQWGTRVI